MGLRYGGPVLNVSAKNMYWNMRNWNMTVFSLLRGESNSPTLYLRGEYTSGGIGDKPEGCQGGGLVI